MRQCGEKKRQNQVSSFSQSVQRPFKKMFNQTNKQNKTKLRQKRATTKKTHTPHNKDLSYGEDKPIQSSSHL